VTRCQNVRNPKSSHRCFSVRPAAKSETPFHASVGAAAAAHRSGSSSTSRGTSRAARQQSSRAAEQPAAPHAYKLPATALSLHHSTSIGTLALHRLPPDAPVNIVLVLVLVLITLPTYSTPRPLLAPFCQLLVHFTTPTGKHAVHGPAHLIANLSRHGSASHPSAIPLPLFFFLPGSGAPSLPPCTSSLGSGR
jgi:hypothetical protein